MCVVSFFCPKPRLMTIIATLRYNLSSYALITGKHPVKSPTSKAQIQMAFNICCGCHYLINIGFANNDDANLTS